MYRNQPLSTKPPAFRMVTACPANTYAMILTARPSDKCRHLEVATSSFTSSLLDARGCAVNGLAEELQVLTSLRACIVRAAVSEGTLSYLEFHTEGAMIHWEPTETSTAGPSSSTQCCKAAPLLENTTSTVLCQASMHRQSAVNAAG